jgi:hypothetical protein
MGGVLLGARARSVSCPSTKIPAAWAWLLGSEGSTSHADFTLRLRVFLLGACPSLVAMTKAVVTGDVSQRRSQRLVLVQQGRECVHQQGRIFHRDHEAVLGLIA